ncbi:MAG: carbohydrate kinase family protein [Kiritimatiellae bacterium]|nr:carbohydrate kinase family protein [Kiritimatiellia bacterium]
MKEIDYISLGFCSNDHLAVLPFIPHDTKVRMLSHAILGGGPAGNAAAGAAALGMRTAFVGTVGDDADGRMILADFAAQHVDTSMVKVRKGATSAIAYIWIEEKTGARSCAWTREGLTELAADEIDPEAIAGAKVLHLDGHNAAGAIAAAKVARETGVLVNYDAGTVRDGMEELLPLADILIFSEECIQKVTGLDNAEEAVRQMWPKYRPKVCGATMGARGSMCYDGRDFVKCPAFKVEKVVDTTGCGDLFHTGFAVRYLETHDLLDCQRFAAAVSAIKCRGLSGRPPSAPTREEVDDFLKNHRPPVAESNR